VDDPRARQVIYDPATKLDRIFKDIADRHAHWTVREAVEHKDVRGVILMACVKEQTEFLCHLWAHLLPDDTFKAAVKVLLDRGRMPDLLDIKRDDVLMISYAAVLAGIELGRNSQSS
jgi:hypothetical protein